MKTIRPYPRLIITKKGTRWTETGHPWIYEGEVIRAELPDGTEVVLPLRVTGEDSNASMGTTLPLCPLENGAIVDAISENGKYLGTGFISFYSKIRLRILSKNANDRFDEAFWRRRVRYALDYRKTVMGPEDYKCCRLIFGEADGFPGLTVDRYNSLLSTEVLSIGTESIKDLLYRLLVEELAKDGVDIIGLYERNESSIRRLEGMDTGKGWYALPGKEIPVSPVTEICENGVKYAVDVENGQKTGFFLDQKYNRKAVAKLAPGKKVLDCFTHTGSFALNAALGGAESVTAVDISETAIQMAKENAKRNGLTEKMQFVTTDVFDYLGDLLKRNEHPFDFIILDPPAFTKSRKTVKNAEKGYREINFLAMKLLPRGGYFATASCSHFMPKEQFLPMLQSAAKEAGVTLKQIEVRTQSPDHPILPDVPETDYLKLYLFQVI